MSRMEYIDDTTLTTDYEVRQSKFAQSSCATCYEAHVDGQVGITPSNQKFWFCSGACQTLFYHDNKLAVYSQETVAVLETMRKKFYTREKLDKNKKRHH
jgi:hypothetical protein